jgi:hypothetical protein
MNDPDRKIYQGHLSLAHHSGTSRQRPSPEPMGRSL